MASGRGLRQVISSNLPNTAEPVKWWRNQFPLLEEQNAYSISYNNLSQNIIANTNGNVSYPEGDRVGHNHIGGSEHLRYPMNFDFRPESDSPLIDAGKVIAGLNGSFVGSSPDIGAYEFGGPFWQAGATWSDPEFSKVRVIRATSAEPIITFQVESRPNSTTLEEKGLPITITIL